MNALNDATLRCSIQEKYIFAFSLPSLYLNMGSVKLPLLSTGNYLFIIIQLILYQNVYHKL